MAKNVANYGKVESAILVVLNWVPKRLLLDRRLP